MLKLALTLALLAATIFSTFAQMPNTNGILFVKKGATGTGNTWDNALGELADALLAASIQNEAIPGTIKQIWVAGGTYYPLYAGDFKSNDDRDRTFLMVKDVQLCGGFAGTELLLNNRNLSLKTNETILSGDLGVLDDYVDNAYHVLVASMGVGTAVLDGFTVVKGNANSATHSFLAINGALVQENRGGGICCYTANLTIANCIFAANKAVMGAGTYFGYESDPRVSNTIISGNFSGTPEKNGNGAAISFYRSSGVFTNIVVSGNFASNSGGAIFISPTSVPTFRNSIVYGNNTGINNYYDSDYELKNSLVQDIAESVPDGVLNGNTVVPLFLNAPPANTAPFTGGDYRLNINSACINAGSNAWFPDLNANSTDIAGKERVFSYANGGTIDMGAYEHDSTVLPVTFGNFSAKLIHKSVALKWHTYTEKDNSHFIVSRSGDGISYAFLSKINAAKNTTTTQNYSFRDHAPLSGKNYYCLMQVDQNGHTQVLANQVINVKFEDINVLAYPNPTSDKIHLSFTAGKFKYLSISNSNGIVLIRQIIAPQQNTSLLSLNKYPPGVYLFTLSNTSESVTTRVIKE